MDFRCFWRLVIQEYLEGDHLFIIGFVLHLVKISIIINSEAWRLAAKEHLVLV